MVEHTTKGDVIVVRKLDRLGRSIHDLIDLVSSFREKGVEFVNLEDSIDNSTATGRFIFNLFASLAEFEREIIRERTIAGFASAKARGRMGGRRLGLNKEALAKAKAVKALFDKGEIPMEEIAKALKSAWLQDIVTSNYLSQKKYKFSRRLYSLVKRTPIIHIKIFNQT